MNVDASTFSDNHTGFGGGAILNMHALTVTNSTFVGNQAESAGAIGSEGTATTITDSTFSGNGTGALNGGAIGAYGATVTVGGTIFTGNGDANTGNCRATGVGAFADDGYNLDTDGTCLHGGQGDISGQDPKLAPLANLAGPTQTMGLMAGSPAIGKNSLCSVDNGGDQRGFTRPASNCDIGAFDTHGVGAPTGLTVTGSAPTVNLTWNVVAGAGSSGGAPYVVGVAGGPGTPGSVSCGSTTCSATVSGLSSASAGAYTFVVYAVVGGVGGALASSAGAAPIITSENSATFTALVPAFFIVTASGFPSPALSVTALPSGVSFTDFGNGQGEFAGTPAAGTGGVYHVTITASNGISPNATQDFTITILQPPAITSGNSATFTAGSQGTFKVTMTGYPAPTASITSGSLPGGVTLSPDGTLSGTPAAGTGGTWKFDITASNGVAPAPNYTQQFTLMVMEAPSIISANTTAFTVTNPGSFTIKTSPTTNPPNPGISESGNLPAGVSFKDNGNGTATLSGTPAAGTGGNYALTLTACNSVGCNSQSFTLVIQRQADTVRLNASPNPSTYGQTVTFTATVSAASGAPSGSVEFMNNGVDIYGCWGVGLNANGVATCQVSKLNAGAYNITANYSGDLVFSPNSASLNQTVNQESTNLVYTGATSGYYGSPATMSAQLTDASTGAGIAGQSVTIAFGKESCSATTDAGGNASCSVTPTDGPATYAITVSYNDSTGNRSPAVNNASSFTVKQLPDSLAYVGATSGDYNDQVTLSAKLLDGSSNTIPNESITFTLGAEQCAGTTNSSGIASCVVTLADSPGSGYTVTATFNSDPKYQSSSAPSTFAVKQEEASITSASGIQYVQTGKPALLTSTLIDPDGGAGIAGRTVTMQLGGSAGPSCTAQTNASGVASCSTTTIVPATMQGPQTISATFPGDAGYLAASHNQSALTYSVLAAGAFVLGDQTAASALNTSTTVTWWGSSWSKYNLLTGGVAPSAFKGFAANLSTASGAQTTQLSCADASFAQYTGSGNSSSPPTTVPAYMAVAATGKITSAKLSGNNTAFTGNVVHVYIVKANAGYSSSGSGTGTVVGQLC